MHESVKEILRRAFPNEPIEEHLKTAQDKNPFTSGSERDYFERGFVHGAILTKPALRLYEFAKKNGYGIITIPRDGLLVHKIITWERRNAGDSIPVKTLPISTANPQMHILTRPNDILPEPRWWGYRTARDILENYREYLKGNDYAGARERMAQDLRETDEDIVREKTGKTAVEAIGPTLMQIIRKMPTKRIMFVDLGQKGTINKVLEYIALEEGIPAKNIASGLAYAHERFKNAHEVVGRTIPDRIRGLGDMMEGNPYIVDAFIQPFRPRGYMLKNYSYWKAYLHGLKAGYEHRRRTL